MTKKSFKIFFMSLFYELLRNRVMKEIFEIILVCFFIHLFIFLLFTDNN